MCKQQASSKQASNQQQMQFPYWSQHNWMSALISLSIPSRCHSLLGLVVEIKILIT